MRISRAGASRSISFAWKSRSSPQAATGSSRSRNSARSTKSSKSAVPIAACWAAAAVGHSVIAQRRVQHDLAQRRTRARAARASRAGSTPASAFALSVGLDPQRGVDVLGLGELRGRERRRAARRAPRSRSPRPGRAASARSSGHASRSSSSRCSASSSGAASVVELHQHLLAGLRPRGSSRSAAARSRRRSRRLHLREVLGQVLAQHVAESSAAPRRRRSGSARAAPSGASAARCRRSPSAPRAARTGTRPRAARRPRCDRMFPPATSAYCSRVAGVIEPRSTSTEPCSSRYSNSGARMRSRRRPSSPSPGR